MDHEGFGRLLPREFNELFDGYKLRKKTEDRMIAWAVSNMMNATGNMKNPVTVESLLGPEEAEPKNTARQDKEELKRMLGVA